MVILGSSRAKTGILDKNHQNTVHIIDLNIVKYGYLLFLRHRAIYAGSSSIAVPLQSQLKGHLGLLCKSRTY